MARPPTLIAPAADAAALLRRLGFAILFAALPIAGLLFRRGVVVLLPVGIALLCLSTLLDGQGRARRTLEGAVASTTLAALAFLAAWATLSAAWAPAPFFGLERLGGALASPALAAVAILALPDRTRAANLYLLPIGVFLGVLTTLGIVVAGGALTGDEDGPGISRGLACLALLLWPAIGWLSSRTRDVEAAALALALGVAVALGPQDAVPVALVAGACGYVLAALGGRVGALVAGCLMAGFLFAAPILALVPRFAATLPIGSFGQVVRADPARLAIGRGLGELARLRLGGFLPASVPDSLPVALWFDLGVVGVLAAAVALVAGLGQAGRAAGPLLPGLVGAVATGFALACMGLGSGQAWWPACLSVTILAFVAVERGQFRTRRPRAGAIASP